MSKNIWFLLLSFVLILSVGNSGTSQQPNLKLDRANSLYFLDNPTEAQDMEAINLFEQVLSEVPDQSEALAFVQASERLGNLYLAYGKVNQAKKIYDQGILIARAFQVADTLVYSHHLYLGETFFALNQLDSSLFHLQQAELLQQKIKQTDPTHRPY